MAKRKPGKYDHIIAKLKPLPPQDLNVQQRVEDSKNELRKCLKCGGTGRLEEDWVNDDRSCHHCLSTGRRKLDANALGLLYEKQRADVDLIALVVSQASIELEAIVQLLISTHDKREPDPAWGAFGASDNSLKTLEGGSIRLQGEVYPVAKNKALFREWCFARGMRNSMELPVKPMTDLVKSILLNGDLEPNGIETYVRTKVVYTPLKTEVRTSSSTDEQADADADTLTF